MDIQIIRKVIMGKGIWAFRHEQFFPSILEPWLLNYHSLPPNFGVITFQVALILQPYEPCCLMWMKLHHVRNVHYSGQWHDKLKKSHRAVN